METSNKKCVVNITLKEKRRKNKKYKRGDIIRVNLGRQYGSIMAGIRFAVIVSNDGVNQFGDFVSIVPLTNAEHKKIDGVVVTKRGQYLLSSSQYPELKFSSVVQTVDIRPFRIKDIMDKIGTVNDTDMKGIARELKYTLDVK